MRYGTVAGLERPVARVVQGTAMFGTTLPADDSLRLLDRVFELGGTTFDTARVYGGGVCERIFGEWCRSRGVREAVVIVGKGAHPDATGARVTPEAITADLNESLERLQTDYIDLYLLHRDDPAVPVGTIVEVLHEHRAAGRIRAYGGSNWAADRIRSANAYAAAAGREPFAATSPNFSLAEQVEPPWAGTVSIAGRSGAADRDWYAKEGMAVFAWSSLAGGFFSGRYRADQDRAALSDADRLCLRAYGSRENFERLARATRLAEERGLTPAQVALAYVAHQPLNLFALVGTVHPAEFEANAAALEAALSAEELRWLDLRVDARPGRHNSKGA